VKPEGLPPIRIGISSCLLGEAVRFDGGHKRNPFLTETLGRFVEWLPVCPEVECGLGTPRESMRLVRDEKGVRLLTVRTKRDLTEQLESYASARVEQLAGDELCGYVVKKDSPSCGLARVKVYDGHAMPTRNGRGLFTVRLLERFPALPVEEEGRLSDPDLRENFVERVFGYWRLRRLFRGTWNLGSLVRFHTSHKLVLMAHAPEAYSRLGRLVANACSLEHPEVERRYTAGFMAALSIPASRPRHTNVLQHMAGFFKRCLDRPSRAELAGAIDEYQRELVPLVVPLTLLRHHVRARDVRYLAGQLYLEPYPKELMRGS
jgi:uncharacterized protein YbgA (DUF1722 family)/uncharacterized protein YbbK (DUF523 family)